MTTRNAPATSSLPPRALRFSGVIFLAGLVGLVIGALLDPRRFFFSWLVAFTFGVSIAVGMLVLVAIAHATRGRWFTALRRLAELPMGTLPIFLLLLLPLFFGAGDLYDWVDPARIASAEERAVVVHKSVWLNVPFFVVRSLLQIGIWSVFAWLLARWSLQQDEDRSPVLQQRMQRVGAAALPVLALTITIASFDWLMSLQPAWLSTIFGIYWFSGGFLGALALLGILLPLLERDGRVAYEQLTNHRIALGKLLLTMVIFWAYAAFMQLLLVWIADLPHEVDFYRHRIEGGWVWVSALLVVVHFAVPFLFLLSRRLKESGRFLVLIGAWLLFAHWLDLWWLVLPVLDREGPVLHLLDFAAVATVVGAAGLFATWRWRGQSLLATGDTFFAQSLRYRGS